MLHSKVEVLWVRQLFFCLSPRMLGLNLLQLRMEFVTGKDGQIFSESFDFSLSELFAQYFINWNPN
jgi:hypothetical protein